MLCIILRYINFLFYSILFYSSLTLNVNVKCKSDYSVQNDESLRGHCTNERRVRKRDKKVEKRCTKRGVDRNLFWGKYKFLIM